MAKKRNVKVIIFDIDGTLSSEVSWLKLTEGLGASANKHAEIFNKYLKREITYKKVKGNLIKLWHSTGNANKKYMTNIFNSWKLKEDAREVIEYLKKYYKILLISGSVDLYVKTVAEKLGIEDWYANSIIDWDLKGNLIDFHYFRNQAAKKSEQFRQFKKKHSLRNKDFAVIGDGDTDLLLFRRIKIAILVKKEKFHTELEPYAIKKINELKELKKIF